MYRLIFCIAGFVILIAPGTQSVAERDADHLSLCSRHEIVGCVVKAGSAVTKFKEGDFRCRMYGGFLPPMCSVPERQRTVLRQLPHAYVQQ
jgi:NADPH:quinone reductase-like Zn-dependent oxidoreductase